MQDNGVLLLTAESDGRLRASDGISVRAVTLGRNR